MFGIKAPSDDIFYKTKLCRFFLEGKCLRSGFCKYAHDRREMKALPDFTRTRVCPELRDQGFCSRGPMCNFAHAPEELRARTRGHAQVIEDFRALLKEAPQRNYAPEVSPVPAEMYQPDVIPMPPAPYAGVPSRTCTQPVVLQGPSQPGAPILVPYGASVCIVLPCGPAAAANFSDELGCSATEEAKATAQDCAEDDVDAESDLDFDEDKLLDLPSNAWSRQSTMEPSSEDSTVEEFASEESEESWPGIHEDKVTPAASLCESAATLGGAELQKVAAAAGLSFALKNSFLAFAEDGAAEAEEPALRRRARSVGAVLP